MTNPFSIAALLVMALPQALLAHAGHHHQSGLPDFVAHILLGLQYLAVLLLPIAAIAFFLRAKRSSNSNPSKKLK
jgi:hydrogenase/urease accessory protein HupE